MVLLKILPDNEDNDKMITEKNLLGSRLYHFVNDYLVHSQYQNSVRMSSFISIIST